MYSESSTESWDFCLLRCTFWATTVVLTVELPMSSALRRGWDLSVWPAKTQSRRVLIFSTSGLRMGSTSSVPDDTASINTVAMSDCALRTDKSRLLIMAEPRSLHDMAWMNRLDLGDVGVLGRHSWMARMTSRVVVSLHSDFFPFSICCCASRRSSLSDSNKLRTLSVSPLSRLA